MGENPLQIELGDRTYTLEEQRIGRIGRKLGQVLDLFQTAAGGEAPPEFGERLHSSLRIFIPDLDPLWKLAGYPSAEAYEEVQNYPDRVRAAAKEYAAEHLDRPQDLDEGEEWEPDFADLSSELQAGFQPPDFVDTYDESADKSPTPGQIIHAVEAIFAVHGGDRMIRLLKNFVSPEMIRAQIKRLQIEAALKSRASLLSQSAPPANGGSAQTSSTTPGRTSELADLYG